MSVDLNSLFPRTALEGKTCAIKKITCAGTCANLRFMLAKALLHNSRSMWQAELKPCICTCAPKKITCADTCAHLRTPAFWRKA